MTITWPISTPGANFMYQNDHQEVYYWFFDEFENWGKIFIGVNFPSYRAVHLNWPNSKCLGSYMYNIELPQNFASDLNEKRHQVALLVRKAESKHENENISTGE